MGLLGLLGAGGGGGLGGIAGGAVAGNNAGGAAVAGGGGGGGGGGLGGLGTSLVGGLFGGIGGIITGAEEKSQLAAQRRRLRDAVRTSERRTNAQVFDILQSPEVTAQRNFLRGLFGEEAFGALGGGDTGLFGGATQIGGRTFFDTAGEGGRGVRRRGGRVGRQLAKGVEAQRRLEGGTNARGRQLRTGQARRLSQRVARGERAGEFLESNRQFLGGAADVVRRRGIGLDAASEFARAGEPVSQPGFAAGGLDPFSANVDRQLQLTLAQQGFNTSLGGAAARALGTGLARTQLQASLLPQLQGLATLGDTLREQFLPTNLNLAVAKSGLPIGFGAGPVVGGVQGALAGFGAGG